MKKSIYTIIFSLLFFNATAQEKTFNYFIGIQSSYSNDVTGKTGFFQYDDYWNYTNKGGYSFGLNIQNGISLKKWVAILNIGLHQKNMSQTYGFFDGWVPVSFGEVNFQIPYFSSDFSIGRKFKISEANALQLTVGYGIEKNLKTDFSGDFNNPHDATIYYKYTAKLVNKTNGFLNVKVAFVMPIKKNELLFGVSLNSLIEEQISVDMENSVNIIDYHNNTISYNRTSLGIFLTYRFL